MEAVAVQLLPVLLKAIAMGIQVGGAGVRGARTAGRERGLLAIL